MADCEKHLVADGEVQRSHKENGVVHRVRKCEICDVNFRTIEMADDKISAADVSRAEVMKDWRRERDYYKEIVRKIQAIKDAVRGVIDELEDDELWKQEDEE